MKNTPSTAKSQYSIGRRILAGGSLLFLIFCILGATAHISMLKVDERMGEMRKDRMPRIANIAEADQYFMRCYTNLLMSKEGNTPADRLAFLASADDSLSKAAASLKAYETHITTEVDRASYQALMQNLAAYLEKRKVYVELVKTNKLTEATAYLRTDIEPSNAIMRGSLDQKLSANLTSGQTFLKEASDTLEDTLRNDVIIFTGGTVLFALIGIVTVRSIAASTARSRQSAAASTNPRNSYFNLPNKSPPPASPWPRVRASKPPPSKKSAPPSRNSAA